MTDAAFTAAVARETAIAYPTPRVPGAYGATISRNVLSSERMNRLSCAKAKLSLAAGFAFNRARYPS